MLKSKAIRLCSSSIIMVAFSLAAFLGGVPTSNAASVLLNENFDVENSGAGAINYTLFANFTVTDGSVDLIGNGVADFFPGNGLYVDMDGTSGRGGTLESTQAYQLIPGVDYTLQFDLGNTDDQFGGQENENTLIVSLGSAFSETFVRNGLAPFETITRQLTVPNATTATLSFQQSGGDNLGVLIDNVSLVAVPEPAALLLALAGAISALVSRSCRTHPV